MASISGGEFRVFLSTDGGTTYKGFALESDCSFELNAETREVTSKDSAVFRSYVTSAKNWTISGSALYGDGGTSLWNPDDLMGLVGSAVDVRITAVNAGTTTLMTGYNAITGDAILTQLSASFPDKDNGSFTFTLQGSGAWTISVNP